jgi:methyl-accepting chemotaxis protein
MSFKNIRIGAQLGLLVGIVFLGFAAVGGLIGYAVKIRSDSDAKREHFNDVVAAAEQARYGLLNLRRIEKDFLMRNEERYVKAHGDAAAKVTPLVDRLVADASTDEERKARGGMRDGFNAYLRNFDAIAETRRKIGLREDQGLMGAMREAVRNAEQAASAAGNKDVTILVLQLRRNEKDFLLRKEDRYVKAVADGVGGVAGAVNGSAEGRNLIALIDVYGKAFAALAEATKSGGEIETRLSREFAAIDPVMVAIGEQVEKQSAAAKAEIEATTKNLTTVFVVVLLLTLAVVGVVCWAIGRAIRMPIGDVTGAMSRLADGALETEVPAREYRNEIGDMAKALQVFKDNLIRNRDMEAAQAAERLAKEKHDAEMRRAVEKFQGAIGDVVQSVGGAAAQLQSSATSLSAAAEQGARQATTVATASEEAATNVQTVAAATEELASSVKEIGRQVAQSTEIASRAVGQAQKTDQTVSGLSEAAQKIGEVVDLIRNIASQTNLLALNATIEAARAGDAGKGFAVVASEVKNLANQTAKATEDITAQIAAIQESTGEAVRDIKSIGTTITEISKISGTIAAAVEEQGAATQEIARNVQEASAGTQQVNSNIAGVTEASSGTGKSANDVLVAANGLSAQSDRLRGVVDEFIKTVRAA